MVMPNAAALRALLQQLYSAGCALRDTKLRMKIRLLLACALLPVALSAQNSTPGVIHGGNGITLPPPPPTEKKPVTDDYHGTKITDDYRWLEDQNSPETRAWIQKQIAYDQQYLSQVTIRPEIVKRLTELYRVEQISIPTERAGSFFFTKRLPEENQASIYIRKGLHGEDERLIDATKMSVDQNTSVQIDDVSQDGDLLVYGVRSGGADEQTVHIFNVARHKDLSDSLPKARYNRVQLAPDKQGLYYSKFDGKESSVSYHALGSDASSDRLLFPNADRSFNGDTFGAMQLISSTVTQNGRYLVIDVEHGVPAKRVDIYVKDLRQPESPIRPIIHGLDNRFQADNFGDDLYVLTDLDADKYRVLKISIADPQQSKWQTIVPESKDVISDISIVGGKLFATGLHDVVTQTRIFDLDGKQVGSISYPGIGSSNGVFGRESTNNGFYRFESFTTPPTIYHYDVAGGSTDIFARPNVPFDSSQYEVKQVFFSSKDGTRIPMFIGSKKGLKRDGNTPTLMYAYGGFLLSELSHWDPEYAWWMEQGGFYAQPNLRGGGEYGEAWHKAGMFAQKQNVFDDFFGAARYLISNKYTSPKRLAIRGRSNGGLLMGAAMTQHPELYGAIWCGFPLLDMLRYQNFLVGRWWTSEYGSAEDQQQFPYIYKYSPYQNVHPGTKYPAIMFHTGDSDTRVAPLHARKMTALMQASSGSDRPILLDYDTSAGHSSGISLTKAVDDFANELAFLWNETAGIK